MELILKKILFLNIRHGNIKGQIPQYQEKTSEFPQMSVEFFFSIRSLLNVKQIEVYVIHLLTSLTLKKKKKRLNKP